jgi:cellulose synthase/poly-beta-1,6-N-acetylglucosamine synthase-like glycosyltransferase
LVILTALYLIASVWLSIYGLNAFLILYLYYRHRDRSWSCPPLTRFPHVTVQVPVYNEQYVVCRVIDAVAAMDWPADRLQIQILDDSTDETVEIAAQCIARHRRQGINIVHRRRAHRTGFKAGALNAGLSTAQGELIAIFDADFCPPANFLQQIVPHILNDPTLGFVQARWGHLNDTFSAMTMAQSIALDGHFAIEHLAREGAGLLTTFNGTGGIWRAECIQACGGWDDQQLTEDVDLSYRAQLAGWRGRTVPHITAPAELPVQLAAFKQQQFRWAKGNTQCLLKLAPTLLRAPLHWMARLQALIHLSYYVAHPLMIVVVLCTLPLLWSGALDDVSLAFLSLATLGPPLLYAVGERSLYLQWKRRLRALPALICTGIGLGLNSTIAIVEAVLGVSSAFQRTPKFQIEGRQGRWRGRRYALPASNAIWGEVALALYATLTVALALVRGQFQAVPFLMLYVLGFGYISLLGLQQHVQAKQIDLVDSPEPKDSTIPADSETEPGA